MQIQFDQKIPTKLLSGTHSSSITDFLINDCWTISQHHHHRQTMQNGMAPEGSKVSTIDNSIFQLKRTGGT